MNIYRVKIKALLSILFILIFFPSLYSQDDSGKILNSLITEALNNNPQIQAAYNKWKAAEYKVTQVKTLPDPMASYTYFGESVETRVGPQKDKYGVMQKIPFPGKLGLKGKAQLKDAQILKEKYEAEKREIIKQVKFIFYDIFWVDKAIEINEEEKSILENLEKAARIKYESNLAPQQDVIKAQVEISRIIDKLFVLNQTRKSLVARLNSVLNRSRDFSLEQIKSLEMSQFVLNLNELRDAAHSNRQELIAADLQIQRDEFERSLAKMDYLPDFTVGFDYINVAGGHTTSVDDGKDAWMTTLAINVPIWFNKLSAKVNEKRLSLEASKKNYENVENSVDYEIEDLYFKINTYKDIISLYKTALIPQTEQSFESAKIAYETQKVDFLNWLDSEKVLLQTRLAYYKSIVDYEKSIAYLERVVGMDL